MTRKDEIKAQIKALNEELDRLNNPREHIKHLLQGLGSAVTIHDSWGDGTFRGSSIGFRVTLDTDLSTITQDIFKQTGFSLYAFATADEEGQYRIWFKQL